MKKFLLIALAVVMMMTLAISAFAAETVVDGNFTPVKGEVTVNYKEDVTETVYYVTVEWEDLAFEYVGETWRWIAQEYRYERVKEGSWVDDTKEITVTNYSNAAVTVTAALSDEVVSDTAVVELDKQTFDLESAAPDLANLDNSDKESLKGTPKEDKFTITASGAPAVGANNVKIATLTVTVAAK